MVNYQNAQVEPKLRTAEALLPHTNETHHLREQIATIRAMLAANQYQTDTIIEQSERALAYLSAVVFFSKFGSGKYLHFIGTANLYLLYL